MLRNYLGEVRISRTSYSSRAVLELLTCFGFSRLGIYRPVSGLVWHIGYCISDRLCQIESGNSDTKFTVYLEQFRGH